MVKKLALIFLVTLFLVSNVLAASSIKTEITIKTETNSQVKITLYNHNPAYDPIIINENSDSDGEVTYFHSTMVNTFEMDVESVKGGIVIGSESGEYNAGTSVEIEIYEPKPEVNETETNETESNETIIINEEENPSSNVSISGFFVNAKNNVKGIFSSRAFYYTFGILLLAGLIVFLIAKIKERGSFAPSFSISTSDSSIRKELDSAEKKLSEAQKELRVIKNQERIKEAEQKVKEELGKLEKLKRGEN